VSRRILIAEDDRSMGEMLEADLRLRGFTTVWQPTAEEAFERWKHEDFDVVLTDLKLPGLSGLDLCERIVANRPDIPVVVITAFGSMETATAAMRAGAYDFVSKPIDMDALGFVLERALRYRALQEQVKTLSQAVAHSARFAELIGDSPPMQRLYRQLAQIAVSDVAVLITGESGTGPAQTQPPHHWPVCGHQLPGPAPHPAGERTLWACAWRVHGCPHGSAGALCASGRRDAVS